MNIDNTEWAIAELERFIQMTDRVPGARSPRHRADNDEIISHFAVVEAIFDRVEPEWRGALEESMNPNLRWEGHRSIAVRIKSRILHDEEISEKLGDTAPKISASSLHPWAWEGAKSLWQSRHYRDALNAAARKVNAETQNKAGTPTLSEVKLFQAALSPNAPTAAQKRLRVLPDDGTDTYRSVQGGVMDFAVGWFKAIRNPNAHVDGLPEMSEHEALEQLAALSQIARWIDGATVESAP